MLYIFPTKPLQIKFQKSILNKSEGQITEASYQKEGKKALIFQINLLRGSEIAVDYADEPVWKASVNLNQEP